MVIMSDGNLTDVEKRMKNTKQAWTIFVFMTGVMIGFIIRVLL